MIKNAVLSEKYVDDIVNLIFTKNIRTQRYKCDIVKFHKEKLT